MQHTIPSFDQTLINYDISRTHDRSTWLVFLHGAGGSLTAWHPERSYFDTLGYSTIAIDLRGHGLSGRPERAEDYTLACFARDIDTVLVHEGIGDFVMIGHCFGGIVTIEFESLYHSRPRAYVLVDTSANGPKILSTITKNHPFFVSLMHMILENAPLRKKHFSHVDFTQFIGTGDYDPKRIYFDIAHTSLRSWLFTFLTLGQFDGTKILENIAVPTLIVQGEEDSIFTVEEAKKLHALVEGSTLTVVPKTNHIIVINNPEALQKEIARFLEEITKET